MPHRWTNLAEGPEIDTVIERDAGLRSIRDAARLLGVSAALVRRALENGLLPDAFQTQAGHWRIPLANVLALRTRTGHLRDGLSARLRRDVALVSPARSRHPSQRRPLDGRALRRVRILEQLEDSGAVRVSSLSTALGVSEMTVRRDLDRLHAERLVVRVFGGAIRPMDSIGSLGGPIRRAKSGPRCGSPSARTTDSRSGRCSDDE
jgi:DNA-binding transcriptional ArsR family regulator